MVQFVCNTNFQLSKKIQKNSVKDRHQWKCWYIGVPVANFFLGRCKKPLTFCNATELTSTSGKKKFELKKTNFVLAMESSSNLSLHCTLIVYLQFSNYSKLFRRFL
jgi:hypothetical protein